MIRFDFSELEAAARAAGALEEDIRYVVANTLNSALFEARSRLINETWPKSVEVRNKTFLRAALRVEKASKYNLRGAVTDAGLPGRANLGLHAEGGRKLPKGHALAIPPEGSVTRNAHGVQASQTPKAIVANTPKRALRVTPRGILVGKAGRLVLKYALKSAARIRADVPFERDFARYVAEGFAHNLAASVARAFASAFRRGK